MFPAYSPKDATAPGVGAASKGAPTAGNNQQAVLQMFRQLQRQIPGFENIPSPSALVEQQRQQHDKEVFKGVSRSNVFAQSINRGGVEQGLKTDEQVQVANMAVFGGNRVDQSQKESGADLVSGAFRSMLPPNNAAQTQKKQEKSGQAKSASTNWQANLLDYGKEENNPDKDKKSNVPPTPDQIQQNYQAFAGYPQYPGYFPYPGYTQYPGYPYPGYQYPGYPPFPPNTGYPALPSNTNPQDVAYPNPQQNYPPYGYMAYDQNGQPIIPPPQANLRKQDPSSSSQNNPKMPKRDGQRSASPRSERERSPNRERQRTPNRERRRSPTRDRQRSPIRDRQRSPIRDRQRERLPRDRQTFTRRDRSRSRSPRRDRSRTPTRDRPRSPRSMIKHGYSDQGKSHDKQNRTMNSDHGNHARIKSEYDSLTTKESNRMGRNQGNNRGGGSRAAGGRGAGQGAGRGANDRGGRGAGGRGAEGRGRGDGGRGGGGRGRGGGGNRNDQKDEEEFSNPWLKSFEQLQAEYEEELRQEQQLAAQNKKSENDDDIIYVGSDEPKQWPWQQTDYKTDRMRDDRQNDNRSGNMRNNDRRDRNEVSKRNNDSLRDNKDRSDRNTNDRRGNDHSKNKDDKYSRSDYPDSRRNNEPPRDRYRNDGYTNDRVGNYSSRGTDNKNSRSDSSGRWLEQYEQLKEKAASREGSESEKKKSKWTRDANGKLQYFPLPPPKQRSPSSDYSKMPPPTARPTKQKAKETAKDNIDLQDMDIEENQPDFVSDLAKGKHTPVQKEKPKRHEIQLKYSSKFVKSQNEETNDYYKSERDKIAEAMASASSSSFSKDQSSTLEDPRKPLIGAQISNPISKFMKTVGKSKGGVKIVAKKYHLPGNCIGLLPPKMAQEVWEVLKKPTKLRDDTLTDVQRWLSLGIIPVIQLIDKFGTGPREAKEVCRMTSDALTVLGYVTWNMSIKRRLLIRSSINKKYAPLCRTLNDISQFLFGDNLAKDLADIKFGSYKFQNSNEEDNDDRLSPNFKQTIFIGLALFGEDVDADLASMINMACANDGNVDDLKEKYKIPMNCEFLLPSKINPEMWSLLSFSGLELDYKLQNVQLSVAEGIVPLMKLLWAVQEGKYDPGEALAILTDALALLGNAVYQLNTVRMEAMLKTLPEQVHGYAHWNWLGAEQISGDNLEKELANCDDEKSKRRAGLIRGVLDSQKNQA